MRERPDTSFLDESSAHEPEVVAQADMQAAADEGTWVQAQLTADELPRAFSEEFAAGRIWLGFMTARLMIAILVLALLLMARGVDGMGSSRGWVGLVVFFVAYMAATAFARFRMAPVRLGADFEQYWPYTVGLDLAVYFVIGWAEPAGSSVSYFPLLALPPLVCAVLGTWRMTALSALLAGLLISLGSWHVGALMGCGGWMFLAQMTVYLCVMLLVSWALHLLARNLGIQQLRSYENQRLARLRGRINDLVVQNVPDGVMVVSANGRIRATNRTALSMLHLPLTSRLPGQFMQDIEALQPLTDLVRQSFRGGQGLSSEVLLMTSDDATVHLMVRTVLSHDQRADRTERMCLLYLQDMQVLQQQVRTEKLAAMGRMSAAVAHEIRNPLAAISQASQLLDEELDQPLQKKLSGMVLTHVERLGRIVRDVLDISRMEPTSIDQVAALRLDEVVERLAREWRDQHRIEPGSAATRLCLGAPDIWVRFDPEHLRRILVNLLDNAWRYADATPLPRVVLSTSMDGPHLARVQVWSTGTALDAALQARLFEPFASGHSRSTGLGLYICRELAQRYGADVHYQRLVLAQTPHLPLKGLPDGEGNAFHLLMPAQGSPTAGPAPVGPAGPASSFF